jgi:DNA-directed RNA polymerase subunit L
MRKIEIKQISWDKTLMNSRLEFDIKGVNHTILNTIRRVVLSSIPIYSFTPEKIVASENTSVFNNNYMKVRISNMPVYGIHSDNPIFVPIKKEEKDLKEVEKDELNDVELSYNPDSINEKFNSNSLKLLTMYVDYVNNTEEIITVGTNDCKFYYAEKQISTPYPTNIPIIKLQPKQKIKLSAITELGTEDINTIFSAVSIFAYKMLSETEYTVAIESRGQLNEKTILQYAYDNIKMMLDNFLTLIPDKDDISGKLLMNNTEHTIGNLISDGLQKHKKVKFGGYNCPHLLDKKIIFHYELNEKYNIKEIMTDIVNEYQETFKHLNKLIQEKIK